MAYTAPQLLSMSQEDLDGLFSSSPSGDIPNGEAQGTAIIAPGTKYSSEIASLINIFVWEGKTFDAAHGTLRNRILAFGLNAIVAEVYKAASWFDNKECIVLDYSKTSLVAEHVRDEIRQIGPGIYLGIVYWDKNKTIHFALQFPICMTILSNPDRPIPKTNTGSALLNWLGDASISLVHLERRFDPFFRPLFDAVLRDPLRASRPR